jgi:hypothetical protein
MKKLLQDIYLMELSAEHIRMSKILFRNLFSTINLGGSLGKLLIKNVGIE